MLTFLQISSFVICTIDNIQILFRISFR